MNRRCRLFRKPVLFIPCAVLLILSLTMNGTAQTNGSKIEVKRFVYKHTLHGDLSLFIHFPTNWTQNDRRPAIVFFFGGAWVGGNTGQFTEYADYLAKRGMIAARVDYRVGPRYEFKAFYNVEDGKSAIRWLRANAETLSLDPKRIAVAGASDGGHAAACAFTTTNFESSGEDHSISSKPNLLILFNPLLNLWTSDMIKRIGSSATAKSLSPLLHLTADMPPTLLMYGSLDPLLPQGKEYITRAKEFGFPAELFTANGENHGFFAKSYWVNKTFQWIDQFLSKYGYLTGNPSPPLPNHSRFTENHNSVSSKLDDPNIKTGSFKTQFKEHSPLSDLGEMAKRMKFKLKRGERTGHYYKIEEESYEVYVPEDYHPNIPYGLLVWVSPGDDGGIHPKGWKNILNQHKLIWIGADNSGNDKDIYTRRISLALDAAYNMQKRYKIDPNRVYIAGLSGGGRVSSMMAFHYPDVFAGGIFMIGVNYWQRMEVPSKPGYFYPASFAKPDIHYLSHAGKYGRYVFLTGDTDMNREQTYCYYEMGYKKYLNHALYIQVPGMGHESPPADWFEKAVEFLDNPSPG